MREGESDEMNIVIEKKLDFTIKGNKFHLPLLVRGHEKQVS